MSTLNSDFSLKLLALQTCKSHQRYVQFASFIFIDTDLYQYTCQRASSLSDSDDEMDAVPSDDPESEEEDVLSELDRYPATKTVKGVEDPLAWWYENRGSYPCLWRMARDYLTIPGECSTCIFI
jgi:hypothetical protein